MTRLRTSNVYGLLGKFNCDAYIAQQKRLQGFSNRRLRYANSVVLLAGTRFQRLYEDVPVWRQGPLGLKIFEYFQNFYPQTGL